ncbi:MAG TPA: S8 family serine peptidase, partial [Candidatus Dormibacteraeota bacterium]|nr:S8 family serine peptidase [Candidatus Dormibacteraeota bacterium]
MTITDDDSLTPRRRPRSGSWLRPLLGTSVLVASVGLSLSQGIAAKAADVSVIVRGGSCSTAASVDAAITAAGGTVTRNLGIINGASAVVPASALPALQSSPLVAEVTPNLAVHLATFSSGYDPTTDTGSAYNTTLMTGAQTYWQAGYTGRGVDVALLDSGVVPVNGLTAPGKVLYGPDLTPDSQIPSRNALDGFGHGTHLAGLIGGRDDAAVPGHYAGDTSDFIGMAPDARIVSVKVADSSGSSDVSIVLAAIDWVVENAHNFGMNIRVLNMSFSTDSVQSYLVDPLAYASEQAWHSGIVVTAAAGNNDTSTTRTQLWDPAFDPYILAVGAADTHGTNSYVGDTVATFSQGGDGNRNPDLVAPAMHLASLRDPGSLIDALHPTAVVHDRLFRGSGTSQAAAIVAGSAALLLQQHPLLTPDQVKALLTSSATSLAGQPASLQGAGELNLRGALYAIPPVAVQLYAPGTGTGSIEGARGTLHLTDNGVVLQGEVDLQGNPVNTGVLATLLQNGTAWNGGV